MLSLCEPSNQASIRSLGWQVRHITLTLLSADLAPVPATSTSPAAVQHLNRHQSETLSVLQLPSCSDCAVGNSKQSLF